jgi:hypothetical protein
VTWYTSQQRYPPHAHIRANAHTLHTPLSKRSSAWAPLGPRAVPVRHCASFRSPSHQPVGAAIRVHSVCTGPTVVAGLPFPRRNQCDVRRPRSPPHAALKRPVHASPVLASGARAVPKHSVLRVEACTTPALRGVVLANFRACGGGRAVQLHNVMEADDGRGPAGRHRACLPPPAGLYEPRRLWWQPLRFSGIPLRANGGRQCACSTVVERPETIVEDRKRSAKM